MMTTNNNNDNNTPRQQQKAWLKSIESQTPARILKMAITVDSKTLAISVDSETARRLTQGTAFQRGINGLAMLDEIMAEMDADMLDSLNLPKKQRKQMVKEMAKKHREILKKNAPPGIDQNALNIFCDES